ncbi:C69 family dipeptidase [Lacticaseibacillus daqingensis]|uniref:C69 family dipeptidase n=1 Tax=Lacticaseibacillus daqingensis TaxID=2486014 RepID=UPI000F79F86C|nr:C69 family dipeptidase [Lacticaseibacillus daqingensis]
MVTRTSCTSILIGKAASADGSVMIGRNEDSKAAWPKHVVVRPARTSDTPETFTSKANRFTLPLPAHALKYTATPEWTDQYGLFEEAGINSAGVAMSATESAYANARVQGADPFLEDTGILEEAMVTVVLPYIRSAQEGVRRLGRIVETQGTGEANGVLFADHDEAWYMEIATGHHWVAQRIPDDCYAVVANQLAIQRVLPDSPDFMYCPDLFDFAVQHHLWERGTTFNFRNIFGTHGAFDHTYNTPRVWDAQRRLTPSRPSTPTDDNLPFCLQADRPLFVEDAFEILSAHFEETEYDPADKTAPQNHRFRPISLARTQEAHVLQLRQALPYEIADLHWTAMGVAAQSQFVPFFAGTTTTPVDYQRGALPPSLDSAYWQYKLASVLMDAHFRFFQSALNATQTATQAKLLANIAATDATSRTTVAADLAALATSATTANATIAKTAWQAFTMQLLAQSTDLSPLNFTTDPNL